MRRVRPCRTYPRSPARPLSLAQSHQCLLRVAAPTTHSRACAYPTSMARPPTPTQVQKLPRVAWTTRTSVAHEEHVDSLVPGFLRQSGDGWEHEARPPPCTISISEGYSEARKNFEARVR
ncbi:hypothetical protein C8T65DRAFT_652903 [Cerioporus squamosus]|nr:hypothetical protein C8T65DRAFT_652903 [Cerioporus squamosus]